MSTNLWIGVASERWWELDVSPLGLAEIFSRLINLRGQIDDVDLVVGDDQRVDLQVGEVQVHIGKEKLVDESSQHSEK